MLSSTVRYKAIIKMCDVRTSDKVAQTGLALLDSYEIHELKMKRGIHLKLQIISLWQSSEGWTNYHTKLAALGETVATMAPKDVSIYWYMNII